MYKRWPIIAQIIIALGCGGGVISLWAGLNQKNWLVAAFGLITTFIFWSFFQLRDWAPRAVNALLLGLLITDILTVAFGMVDVMIGVCALVFRGLILYYFNTKEIKTLFEIPSEAEVTEPL